MGEGYRREGSTKGTEVSGKEGVFERVERGDDGDDEQSRGRSREARIEDSMVHPWLFRSEVAFV